MNAAIVMDRDERGVSQFAKFILENSVTRKKRNRQNPQRLQQQQIPNYLPPQNGILPQDFLDNENAI